MYCCRALPPAHLSRCTLLRSCCSASARCTSARRSSSCAGRVEPGIAAAGGPCTQQGTRGCASAGRGAGAAAQAPAPWALPASCRRRCCGQTGGPACRRGPPCRQCPLSPPAPGSSRPPSCLEQQTVPQRPSAAPAPAAPAAAPRGPRRPPRPPCRAAAACRSACASWSLQAGGQAGRGGSEDVWGGGREHLCGAQRAGRPQASGGRWLPTFCHALAPIDAQPCSLLESRRLQRLLHSLLLLA